VDHSSFLVELLLLIGLATLGVALFERLRLPSIVGFLTMGALVGPGGFGLVPETERVRALAELGVVFLLFEIGLELPLERVRRLWRRALAAGGLQVAVTLAATTLGGLALGLDLAPALVIGGLVAISSTALVMRILSDRGEIDAPQGQLAVGILLFQDLCIVPFLLAVPFLAAAGESEGMADVLFEVARAVVALVAFTAVARFVLPRLLDWAAHFRSRELFTLLAVLVVVGSAVVAEEVGLTLAVGAFIGGLALSASPYAHQLFAEVLPLRGVLLGLFFTAVGMLLDVALAAEQWGAVLAYVAGVLLLKTGVVVAIVALALRQGLRVGVLTGVALAQTGEFSFVLAAAASDAGILDPVLRQTFVAGSVATLFATPFLVQVSPRLAGLLVGRGDTAPAEEGETGELEGHVVVVGFGLAGRNLARVLRARDVPYLAIDANPSSVREARSRKEPVIYGDASRRAVLARLGVARARLVVVAISDPLATRETVRVAHALAPGVPIVARTRYVLEVDPLEQAGAKVVVAEEYESTLEVVAEVLRHFGVPEGSIGRFTAGLREEGYELLRAPPAMILDPWLSELIEEVATEWVEVPDMFHGERSLAELGVRARTGVNVVAVERDGVTIPNPPPGFELHAGDRLLCMGVTAELQELEELLAREALS
jgi:CPA2 family monovalent cation:H+ antiporter-2